MVVHPASHNVSVYRATQDPRQLFDLSPTGLSPSPADLPRSFRFSLKAFRKSCNPANLSPRFGLFHFRSPLLAESSPLLVLLRCFSSDGSPPYQGMTRFEPRRVSPFGYLRLLRSHTPCRSFSQYDTSFFGTSCLGIHCVPFFAFRTLSTECPALLARAFRYYLRVVYSTGNPHATLTPRGKYPSLP